MQDPYVAPLQLQAVSGGGFTYSKQEEEKMRDIERYITIQVFTGNPLPMYIYIYIYIYSNAYNNSYVSIRV